MTFLQEEDELNKLRLLSSFSPSPPFLCPPLFRLSVRVSDREAAPFQIIECVFTDVKHTEYKYAK